ncbi:hypothetical protein V8E51_002353 [Hyaloscypha variabilis]|jgi:hypothetical protein
MTLPIPKLSAGPWRSCILRIIYLFLRLTPQLFFLLIIFSNISPGSDLFSNGVNFHFQRDPVIERGPCLSQFIYLDILYIAAIIRGYRSVRSLFSPLSNDEEKNFDSSMVSKLRALLKGRHYDVRREFADYLANPFHAFPSPSRFSRREQAWSISMIFVLNLMIARLPFREWSKIDNDFPESWDDFFRWIGLAVVAGWVYVIIINGYWEGMSVKVGRMTRQIRRDCLRVGCLKMSAENACEAREAKERLDWWVGEILWDAEHLATGSSSQYNTIPR